MPVTPHLYVFFMCFWGAKDMFPLPAFFGAWLEGPLDPPVAASAYYDMSSALAYLI